MSNVIQFPKRGEKIALYMNSYMYVGTTAESETIADRPGIWLIDAAVVPLKGQVMPADVLRIGSILVMWNRVDAVSDCPDFVQQA